MNDGEEAGFLVGVLTASIGWFMLGLVIRIASPGDHYDRCAPDEVWAWQMAYRADAENREWECVAISDLKEAE